MVNRLANASEIRNDFVPRMDSDWRFEVLLALFALEKNPVIGFIVSGLVNSSTWTLSITAQSSIDAKDEDGNTIHPLGQTEIDVVGKTAQMTLAMDHIEGQKAGLGSTSANGLLDGTYLPPGQWYMNSLMAVIAHEVGHVYDYAVYGPHPRREDIAYWFESQVSSLARAKAGGAGGLQPLYNPF
jgi:hypothetical protein